MTNRRMMDYGETDNDDTKHAIIEFNKETEDEIQELVSITVPEDKTDKKHDGIRRYKALQTSFRDAENEL